MLVLEPPFTPSETESRLLLSHVSWEQYETLLEMFGDRPCLRFHYLEGILEIMTTSLEHEMIKKMIARLLEIYALEKDINLFSCGSATFKNMSILRGLEPDESYCIDTRKDIPDLALEIVITSGGINKLEIYQGLNIKEIWFWHVEKKQFNLYAMENTNYEKISKSSLFPNLNLEDLATYINPQEEPQMIKAFQKKIRNEVTEV